MAGKLHAPKTGVGYSAGLTPHNVTPGNKAHPTKSAGNSSGTRRDGHPASSVQSSGREPKAGNSNMMRKPYK